MKNGATNSAWMKSSNRRSILSIISKKPVSRAELARTTGLTRAAVTLIVDELINDGILAETGTAEANYGRKPVLLDLNSDCLYAAGVSITREGCRIGIMNISGAVLAKRQVNIGSCHEAWSCIETIIKEVGKLIEDSALPPEKLLGIGISTPGPVDIYAGTILSPPNFDMWHHVDIVSEFKKRLPYEIFLENNSTALAIAEKNYGRGADYQSFMLMVVDTGIGAGIIINDRIYRGNGGFGSEVGHASIDMNGKACGCGSRGCLEVYASIPAVLEKMQGHDRSIASWKTVTDRALEGDENCRKAVEDEARYLSVGIVNATNILELEAVILTGDVQYRPEMLVELIREYVGNTMITRNIRRLHIMTSSITEDSEVISSASVLFEKFFKGELEKSL